MSKLVDLTGKKFIRLSVIERAENNRFRKARWLCRCDCGNTRIIVSDSLISGKTKSCGCLNLEKIKLNSRTHGMSKSVCHKIWKCINTRCNNKNCKSYKDYGGRGIKVCKKWSSKNPKGFQNFYKDVGEPPSIEYSIDRINNNKGYYPKNWRWATKHEQARNTRKTHIISFNNKKQCLKDWSIELKISYTTLWHRIYSFNWPIQKAFNKPPSRRKESKKAD